MGQARERRRHALCRGRHRRWTAFSWKSWQVDGSIDAGYNYTRSVGVAQFNLNSDTVYRKPASSIRLSSSATVTQKDDDSGRDDRGTVEASYLHFPWQRWFFTVGGRFESHESLGLVLRSQIGGAVG